jgi:hypothetical protein
LFISHIKFNAAIELLIAMVHNNFAICSAVSDKQIGKFVGLIVKEGCKPLLIKFLNVSNCFTFFTNKSFQSFISMKVNGQSLSSLQLTMVQLLTEYKSTLILFNTDEEKKKR